MRNRLRLGSALLLTALLLAACGGHSRAGGTTHAARSPAAPAGVPAAAVQVIRQWSSALRAGHVATAARLFRLPSLFDAGSGMPVELRTLAQAEAVNAALPCGATFLSAHLDGSYVNALFRLGNRAGVGGAGGCGSGAGLTARTNFLIRGGHIVAWVRAADEPGDNPSASPAPTTPTPTPPTSTQPPAQI